MAGRSGHLLVSWRVVAAALLVMLALDAVDVGLYVLHSLALRDGVYDWARGTFFDMNIEFGFGEIIEYVKSLSAAVALAICARRSGETIFWVLSGLHVWLTLDNSMRFHERSGYLIADHVPLASTLGLARPADVGELAFFLLYGLTALAVVALALYRARPPFRLTGLLLAAAALSPALTGVFVDGFHALPIAQDMSVTLLVIIEDGGETVMISLACALSLGCLAHSRTWARGGGGSAAASGLARP